MNEASKYQILYECVQQISHFMDIEEIKKESEDEYGLEYEEALEMAYDNILHSAKTAFEKISNPKKP